MSKIYTGIELGTNSIKVVVTEKHDERYHVLAAVSSASSGILNGHIVDIKMAVNSVKNALKEVSDMLGVKITKVIAAVPPCDCKLDILVGSCEVMDYNEITGIDVSNVLSDALRGQDFEHNELVTAIPISFTVDGQENIKDPKGMKGSTLETRVVVSTLEKEPLYRILEVLKLSGVETVDVAFTSTGDYYAIKNRKLDSLVGAVVNIGEKSTNVSIFNKGIQIKNSLLPVGSYNVDKDISYILKTSEEDARKLKENFAVAMASYADANDVIDIKLVAGSRKEVNQVGISKLVESRVREILKLAKNEIKNLTNREIRYIIITGGLSELAGFQYLIDDEFGFVAKVCNVSTMGIRHNKYSSAFGAIKYFDDKLMLRDKSYNMMSNEDIDILVSTEQKNIANENIMGKVFGHFFDN